MVAPEADLPGARFEELVDKLITSMGFTVLDRTRGPDGGIDMVAVAANDLLTSRLAIQCKDYSGNVGVAFVRELYGVVTGERFDKGILITNSRFTEAAVEFARDKQIELIDGPRLRLLVAKYLSAAGSPVASEPTALDPGTLSRASHELRELRLAVAAQNEALQRGTAPLKVVVAGNLQAQARFLGQHVTTQVNTARIAWNQVNAIRDELGSSSAPTSIGSFVTSLRSTVGDLLRLQLDAHARSATFLPLKHVFDALRAVHDALFADMADTIDAVLSWLEQGDETEAVGTREISWPKYDSALSRLNSAALPPGMAWEEATDRPRFVSRQAQEEELLREERMRETALVEEQEATAANNALWQEWKVFLDGKSSTDSRRSRPEAQTRSGGRSPSAAEFSQIVRSEFVTYHEYSHVCRLLGADEDLIGILPGRLPDENRAVLVVFTRSSIRVLDRPRVSEPDRALLALYDPISGITCYPVKKRWYSFEEYVGVRFRRADTSSVSPEGPAVMKLSALAMSRILKALYPDEPESVTSMIYKIPDRD